MPQAVR